MYFGHQCSNPPSLSDIDILNTRNDVKNNIDNDSKEENITIENDTDVTITNGDWKSVEIQNDEANLTTIIQGEYTEIKTHSIETTSVTSAVKANGIKGNSKIEPTCTQN